MTPTSRQSFGKRTLTYYRINWARVCQNILLSSIHYSIEWISKIWIKTGGSGVLPNSEIEFLKLTVNVAFMKNVAFHNFLLKNNYLFFSSRDNSHQDDSVQELKLSLHSLIYKSSFLYKCMLNHSLCHQRAMIFAHFPGAGCDNW